MEAPLLTWVIGLAGLVLMTLVASLQTVSLLRPHARWTIDKVYGGDPKSTDPKAYFAFNQGQAWADVVFWTPIQLAGSLGMILGHRWGFVLALVGAVPFWYSAIPIFIWDRDMGFRKKTWTYWVFTWGMFPAFGVVETLYCAVRLLAQS